MRTRHLSRLALLAAAAAGAGAVIATTTSAQPEQLDIERMGRIMVQSLLEAPGNLGVETALTSSGQHVIFAWFEDREALLAWHEGPTHQRTMDHFFPRRPPHQPLEHIPDGAGPILTIASIKPVAEPLPGMRIPVSEMSIEMYTPLPGGVRLNAGFTPGTVPIDGMQEIRLDAETHPEPHDDDDQPRAD